MALILVYQGFCRVDGQSPRTQNLKKGEPWGLVGPKSKKLAKATSANVKKCTILDLGLGELSRIV
jgi:hypothetical protein